MMIQEYFGTYHVYRELGVIKLCSAWILLDSPNVRNEKRSNNWQRFLQDYGSLTKFSQVTN